MNTGVTEDYKVVWLLQGKLITAISQRNHLYPASFREWFVKHNRSWNVTTKTEPYTQQKIRNSLECDIIY